MLNKLFLLTIGFVAVSAGQGRFKGTCGLVNIPEDTTLTNPHVLPAKNDYYGTSVALWQGSAFGAHSNFELDPIYPKEYIEYTYSLNTFVFRNSAHTDLFTNDQKTRDLITGFTFKCSDQTETKYYFKIPLEDNTNPKFNETEYAVSLPLNWNLNQPITDLVDITVCDNAFELGNGAAFSLDVTPSTLARIVANPVYQQRIGYCSSLDLYLQGSLQAGALITINLTATDPHSNSASTVVNIRVSNT